MSFPLIEAPYVFHKLGLNTHMPTDYNSASDKSHEVKWFYRNVSRKTIENIYRKYYQDFLTFGYSADSVLLYLKNSQKEVQPPSEELIENSIAKFQPFIKLEADRQKIGRDLIH